ncbi:hypothetical protein RND81_09G165700 [Saponaria officinalis]|uniref:Uncharacterized protein n=1 Tax=Saponaria officinalis TaxID=3572 RepID=A0AAW1IMW7_SAPOF
MDVWSWISDLPNSSEWMQSNPQLDHELACSTPTVGSSTPTRSIQLRAERSFDNNELDTEKCITFSIYIQGFGTNEPQKSIWVSNPCPILSDQPVLPLLVQLVQEIINRAPMPYHYRTQNKSSQVKVKSDPINWILQTHSPESISDFFNVVLLTRLFWLCACDAPSDVGSFYMQNILGPNLDLLSRASHVPMVKAFMTSVGVDAELCIARAVGYMLAKWLIVREMRVGLASLLPLPNNLGISYACESCGLWMLKGYAPVWAMQRTRSSDLNKGYPFVEAKESALRYGLAHQQLEVHIQLEYKVVFYEGYIQVCTRVDNIRIHVTKLGIKNDEVRINNNDVEFGEELYFPSRVGFWVGPEIGSNYVGGLSLGKSTVNAEKEVETSKLVKGSFGKMKTPKVKTMSRTATKMKTKNWRCDQDVEGNVAVFDAVLYENTSGIEVYSTELHGSSGSNSTNDVKLSDDLGRRYSKVNRPFMKSGGFVFTGKEYGEEVKWRLSREMEGSVLKWRLGGKVWVTYWPSNVESSYYETRFIEWNDEVDLPLISTK